MRVALLAYAENQAHWLMGIHGYLLAQDYEATMYYNTGMAPGENVKYLNWGEWDLEELLTYDRLIVFNGYAPETFAQTSYLKTYFGDDMWFCERGWLPQIDNIYLDREGLGGRSSIARTEMIGDIDVYLDVVKKLYPIEPDYKDEGFILVPLQLENDTSITLDSPYFKKMSGLIHFVKKHFPDHKIVVRPHPLGPDCRQIDGVEYSMEKTLDLAHKARLIIGINSTSLIECLTTMKPIVMLGRNVLSGTKGIFAPVDMSNIREALHFYPFEIQVYSALAALYKLQMKASDPNPDIIQRIIW